MTYLKLNKTIIFAVTTEQEEQLKEMVEQSEYQHTSEFIRNRLFGTNSPEKLTGRFSQLLTSFGLDIPSLEEIEQVVRKAIKQELRRK